MFGNILPHGFPSLFYFYPRVPKREEEEMEGRGVDFENFQFQNQQAGH